MVWPEARRAELEAVAGEGERAGAVTVARIGRQDRQRVDADDHAALALRRRRRTLGDLLEHVGELVAEEDRDDRRRRLVGAEAVVVGGRGHRHPQQARELVHGADHRGAEHQELRVLVRRVAGHQQAAELRVAQREVDVLARSVDTGERLLVEQALHAVLLGDGLERRHQQLLMVGGDVGPLEHRRDLELAGRDLVVAGLGRDAELEQLTLGVHHEAQHPVGDGAEVVVVELLALGRLGAEQRAARVDQVGAREEEVPVDQEVLLLGTAERHDVVEVACGRTASGCARPAHPLPAGCAAAAS